MTEPAIPMPPGMDQMTDEQIEIVMKQPAFALSIPDGVAVPQTVAEARELFTELQAGMEQMGPEEAAAVDAAIRGVD